MSRRVGSAIICSVRHGRPSHRHKGEVEQINWSPHGPLHRQRGREVTPDLRRHLRREEKESRCEAAVNHTAGGGGSGISGAVAHRGTGPRFRRAGRWRASLTDS
eukprot:scaffold4127_cov124-Isochrysis_galbana.AAC.3